MPKQKQYENALGSVFDFIFTESQKRPDKRKPVKVTGVDGTSEYVDAIVASLENPGQFVNKAAVNTFNDMVNPDIAAIDLGPGEKVKFSFLNVKDVLNNDTSFVDKAFDRFEASRKLGKLAWAGEQLSGVVAATWARKYGLDLETQNALFNLGSDDTLLDKRRTAEEKKLGAWAKNRDYLEKALSGEFGNYRNISQADFINTYGDRKGAVLYSEFQRAFREYDEAVAQGVTGGAMEARLDKIADFKYTENQQQKETYKLFYPVFESNNLEAKRDEAARNGNLEQAQNYEKARRGVDLFSQKNLRERYILDRRDELRQSKEEFNTLLRQRDPNRQGDLRNLKSRIKDLDKELRMFTLQERAKNLGQWEGMMSSVKGTWNYTMGGQLLPAIITGDFFDERKNTVWDKKLQPTVTTKLFGLEEDYKVPKVLQGAGNQFMNRYYQMMTDMYYMTPTSLIKTLSNGEGFAYRAFKQKNKFLKMMQDESWDNLVEIERLFGSEGEAYLNSLLNTLDQNKFDKLTKFVKKNKRLRKAAYNFGAINRWKKKISGIFTSRFAGSTRKVRQSIGKWLLKHIDDGPAKKLIGKWMRNGGFKVLIEGLKTSIKAALGATTGGAALAIGFLIDMVADFAVTVGMKIARPIVKLGSSLIVLTIAGFIGILGIVIYFLSSSFIISRNQFSHIAPNEIILGQENFILPAGPGGSGVPFDGEPLPDGVSCILGSSGNYRCTQGPGGSHSHRNLPNAIDVAYLGYFYAPSFCGDGNCEVLENGDYPYCNGYAGGQVLFQAEYGGHTYKFKLVHVEMDPGLSVGSELSAGQIVARIMTLSETGTACSTGAHLHLEMWYDGAAVDPGSILRSDSSGGGFGCNLSSCGE